jgi:Na+-driven multidrug efflux pump
MDIEGVALATVLGQVLSAALVLWYLLRRLHSVQLQSDDFRPRGRVSMTTFSLGIATFTTHILHTIAQILQTNALKTFGALSIYGSEVPITAAGAVAKLTMVFLAAIIGIAIGSQPISGYNLGSRQYGRVKEVYRLVLRYGTIIAVSSYVILQLFPHTILQIFGSDDPLFYQFATRYIRIFLGALFLNTVQPVTSIFCTSIGKAKLGFWMALIRQGLIMIPVLLILPHFLGVDGVLFSGCFSDTVAAIVAFFVGRSQLKWLTKLEQEANA